MKFEVSVEGNFRREFYIEAESEKEACKIAENDFKREIGLSEEDFFIDSITTSTDSI